MIVAEPVLLSDTIVVGDYQAMPSNTGEAQITHVDARGTVWWKGHGAPPDLIPGSRVNDAYLDLDTGDVWWLQSDFYELGG